VVEFLGAPWVAHAVNLNHNEPQLREGLGVAAYSREIPAPYAALLRAGIDVVDDRILFAGIKVGGLEHQSIKIGNPIARFHGEGDGRLPSGCLQAGDVSL